MDGGWPPELEVKSTAAQILGASSAVLGFDKQPLVTKFEISIEALSACVWPKATRHVRTKKEKGQMLQ